MKFRRPTLGLNGVLIVCRMIIVVGVYIPSLTPSLASPISTFADSPVLSPDPTTSTDLTSWHPNLLASSTSPDFEFANSIPSLANPTDYSTGTNIPLANSISSATTTNAPLANPSDSVATPKDLSVNPTQSNCGEISSVYREAPATSLFSDDISFSSGSELYSCSGVFRLTYQNEGNVVLYYTPSNQAIWQESTTNGAYQFYHHDDLDATAKAPARLVLQNDGNLIVKLQTDSGTETETVVWSSATQGTDCTIAFVTDKEKETLVQNFETANSLAASVMKDDVCSLFNIISVRIDSSIQDINPGSTQKSEDKNKDKSEDKYSAALPGRTVMNRYKWRWPIDEGKYGVSYLDFGEARMTKTWYYDGKIVSNAGGGDPERASIEGEASLYAGLAGIIFYAESLGSEKELWSSFHGFGRGAHYSYRRPLWRWETPLSKIKLLSDPAYQHGLSIKGFANGRVECNGGECENMPTP